MALLSAGNQVDPFELFYSKNKKNNIRIIIQRSNQEADWKEKKKYIKIKRRRDSSPLHKTFKYVKTEHEYDDRLIGLICVFGNVADVILRLLFISTLS